MCHRRVYCLALDVFGSLSPRSDHFPVLSYPLSFPISLIQQFCVDLNFSLMVEI